MGYASTMPKSGNCMMPKRQLKKRVIMVSDKIEYIIMLVKLFARHYGLTFLQAYHYVSRYGGIEYAERHYNVLHTLTFDDQVEGLATYCHRKGGELL